MIPTRLLPILAVLAALAPGAARAHAVLLGSTPAPGARLPPGRIALHLRFNIRIDAARSVVSLSGPDGARTLPLEAPSPAELDSAAELPPGAYTLRWQVLATDGHITRGTLPFTVMGN